MASARNVTVKLTAAGIDRFFIKQKMKKQCVVEKQLLINRNLDEEA